MNVCICIIMCVFTYIYTYMSPDGDDLHNVVV